MALSFQRITYGVVTSLTNLGNPPVVMLHYIHWVLHLSWMMALPVGSSSYFVGTMASLLSALAALVFRIGQQFMSFVEKEDIFGFYLEFAVF